MAPSVIHDVNNALNTILSAAFLIDHHADDPDAVRRYAERIRQAAEQGADLVRTLSGPSAMPRGPVVTPMDDAPRGGQRVLVVEDVPEVAEVMRRLLDRAGHQVVCVATCAAAEAALRASAVMPCDVLLTDVGLPDGSGWGVAAAARARWPQLRIGVVTGDDTDIPVGSDAVVDFVLRKPLTAADLLVHMAGAPRSAAS